MRPLLWAAFLMILSVSNYSCHRAGTPSLRSTDQADATGATGQGSEGFFPISELDEDRLRSRRLDVDMEALLDITSRVVKLSLANGSRNASVAALDKMEQSYCRDERTRAWNPNRCRALEKRQCDGQGCQYEHFGNCSGLLLGGGVVITAAHCVAPLAEDLVLKTRSAILYPGPDGLPARHVALGEVHLGKRDFAHHWVVLDEDADPVDVAWMEVDDGGLPPVTTAALPEVGEPVFIVGYPRVERRSLDDRQASGYDLVFGTPSISFGRLADPNPSDLPLCNVDGRQEHWSLRRDCPTEPTRVEGVDTWRGVITNSPFLTTYDSCNGYSGAPVFDRRGSVIGINVTLMSQTDPQERFDPEARMVAIPIDRALSRLDLTP
jgi:hypothetical protein